MAQVRCARCENEGPAIESRVSFAGKMREDVLAGVCQDCWSEWLPMQIMVINEYRLHMGDPKHVESLERFAREFFRLDGGDGKVDVGTPS